MYMPVECAYRPAELVYGLVECAMEFVNSHNAVYTYLCEYAGAAGHERAV